MIEHSAMSVALADFQRAIKRLSRLRSNVMHALCLGERSFKSKPFLKLALRRALQFRHRSGNSLKKSMGQPLASTSAYKAWRKRNN
jgi:hypothetical protein